MKKYVKSNEWDYLVNNITRMTEGQRKNLKNIRLDNDYFIVQDNVATSKKTGNRYKIKIDRFNNSYSIDNIWRIVEDSEMYGGPVILMSILSHPVRLSNNLSYHEIDFEIQSYENSGPGGIRAEQDRIVGWLKDVDVTSLDSSSVTRLNQLIAYLKKDTYYSHTLYDFLKKLLGLEVLYNPTTGKYRVIKKGEQTNA